MLWLRVSEVAQHTYDCWRILYFKPSHKSRPPMLVAVYLPHLGVRSNLTLSQNPARRQSSRNDSDSTYYGVDPDFLECTHKPSPLTELSAAQRRLTAPAQDSPHRHTCLFMRFSRPVIKVDKDPSRRSLRVLLASDSTCEMSGEKALYRALSCESRGRALRRWWRLLWTVHSGRHTGMHMAIGPDLSNSSDSQNQRLDE